jgi:hypothetical protein
VEHAAVRQDLRGPGTATKLRVQVVSDDPVAKAEAEFVLGAFQELKDMSDAELKITVAMDRESGEPEIIYAGVQKKRSLEVLRKVYRGRKQEKRA